VTFACALTRREVYEELGGLDEVMFPNAFGDVDLCAKALERGYRNYYFGTLTGIHHESTSRGHVTEEAEFSAFFGYPDYGTAYESTGALAKSGLASLAGVVLFDEWKVNYLRRDDEPRA
jgi:hypothetical protein